MQSNDHFIHKSVCLLKVISCNFIKLYYINLFIYIHLQDYYKFLLFNYNLKLKILYSVLEFYYSNLSPYQIILIFNKYHQDYCKYL